jgi:hypothetical protein
MLKLLLGPGPVEVRNLIHARVKERPDTFKGSHYKLFPKWWTFHGGKWLAKKHYRDDSPEELRERLGTAVRNLVEQEIPEIERALAPIAQEVRTQWPHLGNEA